MTPTLTPRSPHVAAASTFAVAVLGALVLALEPSPAQQVASVAAVSAGPTCDDLASLSRQFRPMRDDAPAAAPAGLAAARVGPTM